MFLHISGPNVVASCAGWHLNLWRDAALKVLNGRNAFRKIGSRTAFVPGEVCEVVGCNWYISPNKNLTEFVNFLYELEGSIRSQGRSVILTGDFN